MSCAHSALVSLGSASGAASRSRPGPPEGHNEHRSTLGQLALPAGWAQAPTNDKVQGVTSDASGGKPVAPDAAALLPRAPGTS